MAGPEGGSIKHYFRQSVLQYRSLQYYHYAYSGSCLFIVFGGGKRKSCFRYSPSRYILKNRVFGTVRQGIF
jgi:hypothetical protein